MSVTAASIVYEVQRAMNDQSGVRVPAADVVRLLNRAQRDIALSRPDTTATYLVFNTVEGYKQTLPANVAVLISIPANTNGDMRMISRVTQSLLDSTVPDWRSGIPSTEVAHFVYDMRTPRTFLVYPKTLEGVQLTMEASLYPVDIAIPTSGDTSSSVVGNITLADEWSTALLNVTIYYAYLTDLEGVSNPALASGYRAMAEQIIGTQLQASIQAEKRDGAPK